MRTFLATTAALILLTTFSFAEEANGLRLNAQKTLLEKEKDRDSFYQWDKVDKALGIKVALRNTSMKDFPEGTLEYVVIVKRWGHSPAVYEKYEGTEKLAVLLKGAEANLVVAKVAMSGYETTNNRKQFQDSVEAWQLVVKHGGAETIKVTSTAAYEKLFEKARPGR